ncbi:MAG: hypothetical protein ACOY4R_27530 [Pseudomonadota bacterium]
MTRRRIKRLSVGRPEYRRALMAVHTAPKGSKEAAWRELRKVTAAMLAKGRR